MCGQAYSQGGGEDSENSENSGHSSRGSEGGDSDSDVYSHSPMQAYA